MTDINSADRAEAAKPAEPERATSTESAGARRSLEIAFLLFVGIMVLMAFVQAFSYQLVSARTPFVIMVPLLILIGVQGLRLRREGAVSDVTSGLTQALRGGNPVFTKLFILTLVFFGDIAAIFLFGHYVGLFVLTFTLMWVIARENFWVSLLISVLIPVLLYLLFEYLFHIDLYRGLLVRWYLGYKVF